MRGDFSVAQAADALGTSAQTVRALLRKGELQGEKRPWGSRYVWVVDGESLDAFLAQHGRLDGRRRRPRAPERDRPAREPPPPDSLEGLLASAAEAAPPDRGRPDERARRLLTAPFRVRGRATVVTVVVGLPALVAYVYAQLVPGALWFAEVGHEEIFERVIAEQLDFRLRATLAAALVIGANLLVACRGTALARRGSGLLAIVAGSLVLGHLFGSAAAGQLQAYLLWRHRRSFGDVDPVHGRDVGFYVFSLPFYLQLAVWLLTLITFSAVVVAVVYRIRGGLSWRPFRASASVQAHLAILVATLLVLVGWRLRLQQYVLLTGQPTPEKSHSFAGAGFVDVQVVRPTLGGLAVAALVFAALVLVAPRLARTRRARAGRLVLLGSMGVVLALGALAVTVVPHVVQRYVVDPNPLVSEEPYLASSLAATRTALGLDTIETRRYAPDGDFDAADFAMSRTRFQRVPAWDYYVLGARMRQLVTEPPYYRPDDPVPDVVGTGARRRLTAVSARELDLSALPDEGDAWVSDRLSYTHGLGLVRFSSSAVTADRGPRLLDDGLGVEEPRIYFGNLPPLEPDSEEPLAETRIRLLTPTLDETVADSPWVVANTRRPEVDVPASEGAAEPYHYDGSGGIELSSWVRRTIFALALGSEDLLLSDEITPESRLLLHRDVHDRLETLAPFIHWDSEAIPLTADGRIVYVVDGYTTSSTYPYAEQVDLGGDLVNYARASVVATVDAFSGDVGLYVTDADEPVLSAWREVFPTLFEPFAELPPELRGRLRYPAELFAAQATAYERFHTRRPDLFVSGADAWSRPLALSGPIEVAGDVDFDESDEDDLRLTMPPVYIWVPPPAGGSSPRLVLATYYTPRGGQNLVGSLRGWVDARGRARLAALALERDPVTLGPAQVSRLVFATPRVSNLLGLRNLEIRDLDKSSIDAVMLGRPRILLLEGGRVQVQSLYEGSRGPGAARLLGVTAYVDGRAGLGPDVVSAVRQALNEPPAVRILPVARRVVVGRPTDVEILVDNARREDVVITSSGGEVRTSLSVSSGRAKVTWVPSEAGRARVQVTVAGLDGTRVRDSATLDVSGPPPRLRLVDEPPTEAEVGEPVRVRFRVANAVSTVAEVSTRTGIAFTRHFDVRNGGATVEWVPESTGPAELVILVRGTDGQRARRRVVLEVGPRTAVAPPTVAVSRSPRRVVLGSAATFLVRADGCRRGSARVTGSDGGVVQVWRFTCPADPARLVWAPSASGRFTLTAVARQGGSTSEASVPVRVREPQ